MPVTTTSITNGPGQARWLYQHGQASCPHARAHVDVHARLDALSRCRPGARALAGSSLPGNGVVDHRTATASARRFDAWAAATSLERFLAASPVASCSSWSPIPARRADDDSARRAAGPPRRGSSFWMRRRQSLAAVRTARRGPRCERLGPRRIRLALKPTLVGTDKYTDAVVSAPGGTPGWWPACTPTNAVRTCGKFCRLQGSDATATTTRPGTVPLGCAFAYVAVTGLSDPPRLTPGIVVLAMLLHGPVAARGRDRSASRGRRATWRHQHPSPDGEDDQLRRLSPAPTRRHRHMFASRTLRTGQRRGSGGSARRRHARGPARTLHHSRHARKPIVDIKIDVAGGNITGFISTQRPQDGRRAPGAAWRDVLGPLINLVVKNFAQNATDDRVVFTTVGNPEAAINMELVRRARRRSPRRRSSHRHGAESAPDRQFPRRPDRAAHRPRDDLPRRFRQTAGNGALPRPAQLPGPEDTTGLNRADIRSARQAVPRAYANAKAP